MLSVLAAGPLGVLSPADKLAQLKAWVAEDGDFGELAAEWVESSGDGRALHNKKKSSNAPSKKLIKKNNQLLKISIAMMQRGCAAPWDGEGYDEEGYDAVEDMCQHIHCGDHGICEGGYCMCEDGFTGSKDRKSVV